MRLVGDPAARKAAIGTIRELINIGIAGNDSYDRDIFCVDPPSQSFRDHAEVALDTVGAEFLRDGAHGANRTAVQCRLPGWVRAELGLDEEGAPSILMPLASRGLPADPDPVGRLQQEVQVEMGRVTALSHAFDQVFGTGV